MLFNSQRCRALVYFNNFTISPQFLNPSLLMNHKELEGATLSLDFTKLAKAVGCGEDILPTVAQDIESGELLRRLCQ